MTLFRGRLFAGRLFGGRLFRGLLTQPSTRGPASGGSHVTLPWPQRRRRIGAKDDEEVVMFLIHMCGG
jgi:hypothetical protein